ncbi:hypothetical protein ACFQJ7_15780 [Halovenus rubra]|uniref:Uncharacterized protein n=2 Tax=Halovenus rubra TaxID=869890 RepID=A0ACC7E1U1_9EURY|nr:hypothetical protein [Halovenus rubra]
MGDKLRKTRRRFLAGISVGMVGGFAGCTEGENNDDGNDGSLSGGNGNSDGEDTPVDSDGDGVPDIEDDFPSDSTRSELFNQGRETYDLNEDYYQYLQFSPRQAATLSYNARVQNDIRIDVILMDSANFRYFEDGTEWEYYPAGSELDTLSANNEVQLSGDTEYCLVIDNTNKGRTSPPTNFDNDRVDVTLDYELFR